MLKQLKARSSIRDKDQEPRENKQWFRISPQSSGVSSHPQPLKIRTLLRELKDGCKNTQDLRREKKYIYIYMIRRHHSQPKALMGKPLICNSKPLFCLNPPLTILSDLLWGNPPNHLGFRKDLSSCTLSTSQHWRFVWNADKLTALLCTVAFFCRVFFVLARLSLSGNQALLSSPSKGCHTQQRHALLLATC